MSLSTNLKDLLGETEKYWYVPLTAKQKAEMEYERQRIEALEMYKNLSYDNAKIVLKSIILQNEPKFQFTPEYINVCKNFCLWVWRNPLSQYDLSKGLLFIGRPGTGKTTLMKSFSEWTKLIQKRPFEICEAKLECDRARKEKSTSLQNSFFKVGGLCIDEIGHEKGEENIWGNKLSYIGDLMEHRYARKLITHGTTNVEMDEDSPKHMSRVYESRVVSRMNAMFNIVDLEFNEIDWRNQKEVKKYYDNRKENTGSTGQVNSQKETTV